VTVVEQIWAYLKEAGPQTTKQIRAHFGGRLDSVSAKVAHARSYGYIEPHERCRIDHCHYEWSWRARPEPYRKPGQGGVRDAHGRG
jgi:hypothetical protein